MGYLLGSSRIPPFFFFRWVVRHYVRLELWSTGLFVNVSHDVGTFYLILEREVEVQCARTRKQMTGAGMEGEGLYVLEVRNKTGAIIPELMHRIPSELHSYVCLDESSSRMVDLLGSTLLHPFFCR